MKGKHAGARSSGFTLIELMLVVVITGVLAAIAIPSFSGYVMRSRTSEAVSFLGVIKLRQEAFRSEFGQYLQCANMESISDLVDASFNPVLSQTPASASLVFPTTGTTAAPCFTTLGASPDGPVRFRYSWAAGTPAQCTSGDVCTTIAVPAASTDHYFVAQGRADLDDDGTFVTFELTSFTRNIWISDPKGWD